jgi:hypothetical protein
MMPITTGLKPKALRAGKAKKLKTPKVAGVKKPKSVGAGSRKKETPLDKLLKGE